MPAALGQASPRRKLLRIRVLLDPLKIAAPEGLLLLAAAAALAAGKTGGIGSGGAIMRQNGLGGGVSQDNANYLASCRGWKWGRKWLPRVSMACLIRRNPANSPEIWPMPRRGWPWADERAHGTCNRRSGRSTMPGAPPMIGPRHRRAAR